MSKTNNRDKTPRQYHVVLTDGQERTLTAAEVLSLNGALLLSDAMGDTKVMYAPGQWSYVELETQDE